LIRAQGFTLIEVLVALVVVTFGMAAVLASLTSAADTTAYLRERSFAEWVAMNRIAEVRLQARRPNEGKSSGDAELAGRRWRWEQEVVELDFEGLHRIDVRVRPEDGSPPGQPRAGAWVATVSGILGDAFVPFDGQVPDFGGRRASSGSGQVPLRGETPSPPDEPEDASSPPERPPERPDTR
jgi:general secretion pathway protein I